VAKFDIKAVSASPKIVSSLSEILIDVVAQGGSVSFMHPLDARTAGTFWDDALAAAARGERVVLGAWDGEILVGPSPCCSTVRPISRTAPKLPS